jgi:hypothetical protein
MESPIVAVMEMLTGILISLGFFAAVFFAIYFTLKARHKERTMLIERGLDLSESFKRKGNGSGFFKFGVVTVGISIGLIFGNIFSNEFNPVVSYFSMILLFGGIAIIVANYLAARKKQ